MGWSLHLLCIYYIWSLWLDSGEGHMQEWAIGDGEGNIAAVCATATGACFVWLDGWQPARAQQCALLCSELHNVADAVYCDLYVFHTL